MIKQLRTLALVGVALVGVMTTARADMASNTNYNTLQILPTAETSLAQLVNQYFALSGAAAYANSNDLYQDRGIKSNVTWNLNEGAQIIAHSKSSRHALEGWYVYDGTRVFLNREFGRYDSELRAFSMDLPANVNIGWDLDIYNAQNQKEYTLYDDPLRNPGQQIAFITFDITDLMRQKYAGMEIESAYLVGWEDGFTTSMLDYDYQDSTYIIINPPGAVTPPSDVPEPATALLWGLGCLGTVGARYIRKRRVAKH